ncbi:uncharacterized protein LOC123548551 [Mercenaria mercenaria]|uniref:uncharacterized protein LOC123548551 n=1 Tax=Mercenaria mercenaria TaxID=6596 RepID=UPI00234E5FDB|nr:uncharacterized protein LOC123548551 [Mercenaria mercenaria]
MDDELRDPEYQNFVSIYRGFAYVGEKLEPYTKEGLDTVYQKIYGIAAGYHVCQKKCSETFKCRFSRWCGTCKIWRRELLKTRRYPNILWEQTESWKWQHAYENIAEVYLPGNWQNGSLNFKDISTACFIWENCAEEFNLRPFIIKKIRQFRNEYFAHNSSLKASATEKAKVFDVLKDLLKDPDVKGKINFQECMAGITKIEEGYQIEKWMTEVQNLLKKHDLTLHDLQKGQETLKEGQKQLQRGQENLQGIQRQQHELQTGQHSLKAVVTDVQISQVNTEEGQKSLKDGQENLRKGIQDLKENHEKTQKEIATFREDLKILLAEHHCKKKSVKNLYQNKAWVTLFLFFIVSLLALSAIFLREPTDKLIVQSERECVSEQYSIPFPQDLPLLGYINEHKSIGRLWLMDQLENELISSDRTNLSGIVLVAEMGYGKSAFVSNLLCPGETEKAKRIQKHIVAFHICNYDVMSTRCAERFIRRLVGFFAMKSAEYGNIISMLPEKSILYNRESCEKEPEACFDQGITLPLKQLSVAKNDPWLVVVDALDECETSGSNPILKLLSSRAKQLPKWLKLLITSRNISSLKSLKKLKFEYLLSNDSRNIDDIKSFIQDSYPTTRLTSKPQIIDSLINKSEGNFIYVVQALKWIMDNEDIDDIPNLPNDLGNIYEMNFERQFKDQAAFDIPKAILEIVCSTLSPVTRNDIYAILKFDQIVPNVEDFDHHFHSLEYFLRMEKDVRVSHQALFQWLICKQNQYFGISLQQGHSLISRYMFRTIDGSYDDDLVDLTIHVADSADSTLKKLYISSKFYDRDILKDKAVLHRLIWRTSSVKALELLLHHYSDVNIKNKGNVTPAFVAAAKGHIEQLILLQEKGASIDFRVKGNFLIHCETDDVFRVIEMMKNVYYSGYGLLHVAAQHGHVSIVRYILNHNTSLLLRKNTVGLHAGHVACENGHLNILIEMSKVNQNILTGKCLYYAARNNHLHIVKWLTENGVKLKCISNEQSRKAANKIANVNANLLRDHDMIFPQDIFKIRCCYMNPIDEWWIVYKTTPLLAAIITGSSDTARYLIHTFPASLDCIDVYGYTAALTSVIHNDLDLLPLLAERLITDKCENTPEHLQLLKGIGNLKESNAAIISSTPCSDGETFAHIVALKNLEDMISYAMKNQLEIKWNEPDRLGNFPIHYAVSKKNCLFIYLIEKLGCLYTNIRAQNGSTIYHTAAMTKGLVSFYSVTESLKKCIPDLKDYHNLGVIHYLVSIEYNALQGRCDMDSQLESLLIFRFLVEQCNHDVLSVDDKGRNLLHYGVRNGHFSIVNYLIRTNPTAVKRMLNIRDKNEMDPITFAILELKMDSGNLLVPECKFYNIFNSTECLKMKDAFMTSKELSILYLLETLSAPEFRELIEPNLVYFIEKSPYLMTAILWYHKSMDVNILKSALGYNYQQWYNVKLSHLTIARHKPGVFHACGKALKESPLHHLLLNIDHKDTAFSEENGDEFLRLLFKRHKSFFNCEDDRGFNIFHYSLIGGNIQTARILMKNTITMLTKKVTVKDIFVMALSSRIREANENFEKCGDKFSFSDQKSCTDLFLYEFFIANIRKFESDDFCANGSTELSLVHLLSANGMIRTLRFVNNAFGNGIFECRNKDDLTPLYLSKLFKEESVATFIEDKVELKYPLTKSEEWLLWSMLYGFPQTDLHCHVSAVSGTIYNFRQVINDIHCIERLLGNYSNIITDLYLNKKGDYSESMNAMIVAIRSFQNVYYTKNMTLMNCRFYERLRSMYDLHFRTVVYKVNLFLTLNLDKDALSLNKAWRQLVQLRSHTIFYPLAEHICLNGDTTILEWKFGYAFQMSAKMLSILHKCYIDNAVDVFFKLKKSVRISVPNEFSFLHSRMGEFKFTSPVTFKLPPLIATDNTMLYNYRHLNVIKATLAYKRLNKKLEIDYPQDFSKYKFHELHPAVLKNPFVDFEDKLRETKYWPSSSVHSNICLWIEN